MNLHNTLSALALAAAALAAVPAQAALSLTGVSCSGHGTAMTSQPGYQDCSGAWAGNNLNQAADVSAQILSDWGLTDLIRSDITGAGTGSSGSLSFANQTGLFVISLKAGNAFSLYEFDGSTVAGGISSISFDTLGVGFFSGNASRLQEHFGQGLSHADIYAPVPEPGTYALMLAGLAAVGFVARRRRVA